MKNAIAVLFALVSLNAIAATDPAKVEQMDKVREGQLATIVLKHFINTMKVACDEPALAKFQITKLEAASVNEEKKPDTYYTYEGQYLVSQKCHSGSTYAGAYISLAKSVILKGEFRAQPNASGAPKKLESLKITLVREVDLKSAQ